MALRFHSVELRNWRNFRHVAARLERRVFLVGPNAAGKSNFLDVFGFLHDLASVGGGFQDAVLKRGGVSSIRALSARQRPDIVVSVVIGDEELPPRWEYQLAFGASKTKSPIIKSERVIKDGKLLIDRPDNADKEDPARLTQTHLEQVNVNKDFRELSGFFQGVRYLHLVPQLVREPDRSVGRVNDPYGGDFLERVASTPARVQRARLKRITEALRVAVPQLQDLELTRDEVRGTPHLEGRYEHWRPQGARQTEERFSDGTLRLMGLLWAVLDGSGTLLLEEPELSLHSGVVRYLPQIFARVQRRTKRQIILSTHSPDLLQDPGIGLDEVLLLIPEGEGTLVIPASDFKEIPDLLSGGLNLAEAILPRTSPKNAEQLGLFEA